MIALFFAIITLEVFWNPNPAADQVTVYELLISASQNLSSPTIVQVPPTPDPVDGKIRYVQANWDASVVKYIGVRAVNAIATSAPTGAVRVGEPVSPLGLTAQRK